MKKLQKKSLPESFKPLLWSYDFSAIDPEKNKKVIIINAINYGNLYHWHWLVEYYGKKTIKEVLEKSLASEIRPKVKKLASIIFSVENFNYAPRGIKR